MENALFVSARSAVAQQPYLIKTLRVMKLVITLTLAACLHASAKGYSQTITLSLKNVSLEKAFAEIQKQSAYSFFYTREQLANTTAVTIIVKDASINEVLEVCFKDQPVTYTVAEKYIIVKRKEPGKQTPSSSLIDLRGKVVNENGESLEGVTITARNSGKVTSTNDRGEFMLKAIDDDDDIIITSVGYYKEVFPINKQTFFLIALRIAVESLDETIVKGYYTTSRRLNTGAVSKVNNKDIMTQPVSNPLAALQARVPGLLITQANGLPGSNFSVRIRGQNSIQNGNSPF